MSDIDPPRRHRLCLAPIIPEGDIITTMKKSLLISLTTLLLFATFRPTDAQEPHPQRILFINQVRGRECCDPGSLPHLKNQIAAFENSRLPAAFALRYDALNDTDFTQLIDTLDQDQYEIGLFLEITPELARESGVSYHGTEKTWYQAQHAYPIGYSEKDRRALVDTAIAQFRSVFGQTPNFTVGWIIDTPTLRYLNNQYGVSVHEITREQWGTDSYTLKGGPIHYPYLGQENWAFIPDSQTTDDALLMLRQTVSDPLRNYGDTTNSFTTQPNDYMGQDRTIDYFKQLLDQMLTQTHNPYSFALLGLENSMEAPYQTEFLRQIEHVAQLEEGRDHIVVTTPTSFHAEYQKQWSNVTTTLVTGTDLIAGNQDVAFWITGGFYRVRILKQKTAVKITDLRIYHQDLIDPYAIRQAKSAGFWVAPFLLDGSRFYGQDTEDRSIKQRIRGHFLPELKYRDPTFLEPKNDLVGKSHHISLPDIDDKDIQVERINNSEIMLSYQTPEGDQVRLLFKSESFSITAPNVQEKISLESALHNQIPTLDIQASQTDTSTLVWTELETNNAVFSLSFACLEANRCNANPAVADPYDWRDVLNNFYPYFFPDAHDRKLNQENTILYAHNRYAIAGRNPVRFVLIPKDQDGYTLTQEFSPEIESEPAAEDSIIQEQNDFTGTLFIDLIQSTAGAYRVTVSLNNEITKEETVYFTTSCRHSPITCLRHPTQLVWYSKYLLHQALRN